MPRLIMIAAVLLALVGCGWAIRSMDEEKDPPRGGTMVVIIVDP